MLRIRQAGVDDVQLLAAFNERLIEDEGHENPLRGEQLVRRMRDWLTGKYQAALGFVDDTPALYALWRPEEYDGVYLRHFFVARDFRRRGLGRAAMEILHAQYWYGQRLSLDALVRNQRGVAFWRSLGFQDYALALRKAATTSPPDLQA